jgi:hypothetical protein
MAKAGNWFSISWNCAGGAILHEISIAQYHKVMAVLMKRAANSGRGFLLTGHPPGQAKDCGATCHYVILWTCTATF